MTDQHSAERLAHFTLQPGDIAVADNGYGYRSSVATAVRQQADVVLRITPATFPVATAAGEAFDLTAWLRQGVRRTRSGRAGVSRTRSGMRSACWPPACRQRRPRGRASASTRRPRSLGGPRQRPS